MIGGHLGEVYRICKNFSVEEKKLALMTIPTQMLKDELERRSKHCSTTLDTIYSILGTTEINNLDDAETVIKALREAIRV